jgi:hypothetical protein
VASRTKGIFSIRRKETLVSPVGTHMGTSACGHYGFEGNTPNCDSYMDIGLDPIHSPNLYDK